MSIERPGESTSEQWYALHVQSRHEKVVSTIARGKGYEEYLPVYQSRRRWSDRLKSVDCALFPGYVFCRLDPRYRLPLLTIPGVLRFVGVGNALAPIDDEEIAAIRTAMSSGLSAEPWPFLEAGQRVRLQEGPLAGMEGLLVEVRKRYRVVVSVTLLQRSVAVEIEREWVAPLNASGRPVPMQVMRSPAAGFQQI
jgi:transcription antitermination factor NusG